MTTIKINQFLINIYLKQKNMEKIKFFIILFVFLTLKNIGQNCSFSIISYSSMNTDGNSLQIGDYNNDGKFDFISVGLFSLTCNLQTVSNNFSSNTQTMALILYNGFLGTEDLNNDGKKDVLTMEYFLAGQGNGTFTSTVLTPSINTPYGKKGNPPIIKDFNNDGKKDLLIIENQPQFNFKYYSGLGTGQFTANSTFTVPNTVAYYSDYINNDGNLDLIVGSTDTFTANQQSTVTVMNGQGNGTFTTSNTFTTNTKVFSIITSDMNNDGNKDIILNSISGSNRIQIFLGNGNGNFTLLNSYSYINELISADDINNDGFNDVVYTRNTPVANGVNVPTYVSICYNNGTGNLLSPINYSYVTNGNIVGSLFIKDLNNDNLKDIAVNTSSSTINNNNTIFYSNTNCVWPGDANSNGIANNSDILEIGLQFNQTGAARTSTSNIWDGYSYTAWTGSVSTGKNKAHADCNGDGTVNLNDTLAIFNNYGFMHNKNADIDMVNPDISIVPDQSNVLKNTWGTASIFLGDASNNISNIHGVAFNVNYDNSLIETDSVWIEYTSSFINSNNLHFRKKVFSNGVIYTATTHTNQVNASGNGKIAILHYKIKPTLASNTVLNLSITNASKLSATAITSTLSSGTGTLNAVISNVGIKENSSSAHVAIFPNPSKGQLTIKQTDKNNFSSLITIYNSTGQIVLSKRLNSITEIVDTNLSNGIYFLVLSNSAGQIFKDKIIIE